MTLRTKLILITTVVVTILFGLSEWLSYQHTTALLDEHEAILRETADHTVALQKLQAARDRMFLNATAVRVMHAVITLLVAVAALNLVWYRVIYRPIQRLLSQINSMSRGTWQTAIPVERRDEIGELTVAFNKLGQELTSSFEHINAASKLSAFALLGGRLVRSISSLRNGIAAAEKGFSLRTDAGYTAGMEALKIVQTRLDGVEAQFDKDFDEEFCATCPREGVASPTSVRPRALAASEVS